MSILAIVPARSESKRLPKKNIMPICGKPLIHWTLETASWCERLSRIVISTDSTEIAQVSVVARAEAPFIRPYHLATDTAATKDVVFHALNWYEAQGESYDYIMLLQPTSPLRESHHINRAIDLIEATGADSVVSVCEMEHSPLWSMQIDAQGYLDLASNEKYLNMRGQDLPKHYRINGAIYLTKTSEFIRTGHFAITGSCVPMMMNYTESIDVDSLEDMQMAEYFLKKKLSAISADVVSLR